MLDAVLLVQFIVGSRIKAMARVAVRHGLKLFLGLWLVNFRKKSQIPTALRSRSQCLNDEKNCFWRASAQFFFTHGLSIVIFHYNLIY